MTLLPVLINAIQEQANHWVQNRRLANNSYFAGEEITSFWNCCIDMPIEYVRTFEQKDAESVKALTINLYNINPILHCYFFQEAQKIKITYIEKHPYIPTMEISTDGQIITSLIQEVVFHMKKIISSCNYNNKIPSLSIVIEDVKQKKTYFVACLSHWIADYFSKKSLDFFFDYFPSKGELKTKRKMPDFREYLDFISPSFSNEWIATKKRDSFFFLLLENFRLAIKGLKSQGNDKKNGIEIEIDITDYKVDTFFLLLSFVVKLASYHYETLLIPIKIVTTGRTQHRIRFQKTIGDLHDKLPFIFDKSSNVYEIKSYYEKYIESIPKESHFISMSKYDSEIESLMKNIPITLNYFGETNYDITREDFEHMLSYFGNDVKKTRISSLCYKNKLKIIIVGALTTDHITKVATDLDVAIKIINSSTEKQT